MKLTSYFLAIGVWLFSITPSFGQFIDALSTAPKKITGEFITKKNLTEIPADKARKKIVENIEKRTAVFQQTSSVKAEQLTDLQFIDYFSKLEILYKNELKSIEESNFSSMQKIQKKSELEKSFSVAYSGQCINKQIGNQFVITQDTDNEEIAVMWNETARENPRYSLIDDYQQGFARIKKDEVYGFWDFCGNEVIIPQYDYADRFNDGKAIVKKFTWHFVNFKGEESEALHDVIDAKALKYGISAVKFSSNKMALIDNQYDATKEPISEEFDEISSLTTELFLVREGKKFGIISVEGKTIANVVYDKIWMESKNEIGFERNKKITKKVISNDLKVVVK